MTDRTTKLLLAVIALLLIVLLVRPMALAPTAAQAQTGFSGSQAGGQMIVQNNLIYVLHNGQVSIYDVEDAVVGPIHPPVLRLHKAASTNLLAP